jgi:hypothetical protein
MTKTIKPFDATAALNAILAKGGRYFAVTFIKKDGSVRDMVCRLGVGKFSKGVETDRLEKDLEAGVLTVWDREVYDRLVQQGVDAEAAGASSYRRINLDAVLYISGVESPEGKRPCFSPSAASRCSR